MVAITAGRATYAPVFRVIRDTDQFRFPQKSIGSVEVQEHFEAATRIRVSDPDVELQGTQSLTTKGGFVRIN